LNRRLLHATLAIVVLALAFVGLAQSSAAIDRDAVQPDALNIHQIHQNHTQTYGQPVSSATGANVAPLLDNLGDHHHSITTSSPLAQRYFDEGLVLTFGFNHPEAIRSFRDAATLDPECAMCYWGIAFALGPNINAPMADDAVPEAYAAVQKALELAPKASAAEQGYIRALATRYAAEPTADRSALDVAFADAMRDLSKTYPDDLDAATIFGEALMDLTPWAFWKKDGEPTQHTAEIVATLESVLARNPNHPAANHYYIHAVEASNSPERAIPSADRLRTLVPGAGHLVHMPAHVYWRVGRYHDAAVVNEHAINADEQFIVGGTPDGNAHSPYAITYYPHNIHFLFAASHMQGRSQVTVDTARKLVAKIPEAAYVQIPPLEDFRPMPLFALVRFGRWAEILEEPRPPAELQYSTGIWHWARGLAHLRQGKADAAQVEYERLAEIAERDAVKAQTLASFPKAATLLDIAKNVLVGELAAARGETEEAVSRLEAAAAMQDDLAYIEPPAWFYPVRHNLGAILLEAGRAAEAEAVYREDLRQYPENGWSLFGLAESLRMQGKATQAAEAQGHFEKAWGNADVTLTASRF
jgi:tetratricopeptide (TPR) repeat protein